MKREQSDGDFYAGLRKYIIPAPLYCKLSPQSDPKASSSVCNTITQSGFVSIIKNSPMCWHSSFTLTCVVSSFAACDLTTSSVQKATQIHHRRTACELMTSSARRRSLLWLRHSERDESSNSLRGCYVSALGKSLNCYSILSLLCINISGKTNKIQLIWRRRF